jgi:hypothetical protein
VLRTVVQENNTFSEHPTLFVLDRPLKLIQHLTINLWCYSGPWCHKLYQQNSLTTFWTSSLVTIECRTWPHSSWTTVLPSLNFLHHSLTRLYLITLLPYTWHNQRLNVGRTSSLCIKKMNHSTYLTAGGSSDDNSVHVASVIIPKLCSENLVEQ